MASNNLEYTLRLKDLFSKSMKAALVETKNMDNQMNSLKSTIQSLAVGFGGLTLGKQILDVGVQFDSIKAGLETLTGSAENAAIVFEQIKKDAASTPFDVGSLATANQMLIGAGANAQEARNNVLNLGNAIAATGGSEDAFSRMSANLAQIKSLGKASAADVKQFAFANIPIYTMLSKTTGKTVKELKEMDISYEMLTKSFELAAQKGGMFYKGLEKQSKTVGGQISNLKDNFNAFLYTLYERSKPAITFVISGLNNLITLISKLLPLIKIGITLWASYYIKLKIATAQSYHFAVAQRAMAMGMSATSVAATWVSRGIRGIGAAIKSVPIIGWVMALVEGVQYLWETFSGFREAVYSFIEGIKTMGTTFQYLFSGIWNILKGNFELGVQEIKNSMLNVGNSFAVGAKKGRESFMKDKQGIGGDLSGIGGSLSAVGGVSGGGSSTQTLGSGSEVSGKRPQSLTINIDKLIEQFNLSTTNIQEGTTRVKEMVAKALLESVNDINLMATS
jgi:tape measure domain-containing protein